MQISFEITEKTYLYLQAHEDGGCGEADLSDMTACMESGGGADDLLSSLFGGSSDAPPDIMSLLAPRTDEEVCIAY